jgi:hypothetical protein
MEWNTVRSPGRKTPYGRGFVIFGIAIRQPHKSTPDEARAQGGNR